MAGMVESIKKFFTLEDEDFSSDTGESSSSEYPSHQRREPYPSSSLRSKGNLISLPASARKEEIVVLEPSSFGDAREIAETLKQKKSILLNMRKTDKELARRIVDFLSGISYAVDGHSQKVAEQIYLFTPGHIEIVFPHSSGSHLGEEGRPLEV